MEKVKVKCNIYAPIGEYSYYGSKSRFFIKHLLKTRPDLNIHIVEYQANKTRNGLIDEELKSLVSPPVPDPDVCFYIGPPSLYDGFGRMGNIGFLDTTTIYSVDDARLFIDKCNKLSAVFVPSNYAKTTLSKLKYMGGNGEEIKITTPIIITTEYSIISELEDAHQSLLDSVTTENNFLLEGRWDTEDSNLFGGKNKDNISYVVTNFLNTFKDIENAPGLIVNVYGDVPGTVDKRNLEKKLNEIKHNISYSKSLPKVYLLNGILTPSQTKSLYNDPKVLALIHLPQRTDTIETELNFMTAGKPIIFSKFGAQAEVLNYDGNIAVNCAMKELKIGVDGAGPKLADVYGDHIKYALYETYFHYDSLKKMASENCKNFLLNNNKDRVLRIFDQEFDHFVPVITKPIHDDIKIEYIPDFTQTKLEREPFSQITINKDNPQEEGDE